MTAQPVAIPRATGHAIASACILALLWPGSLHAESHGVTAGSQRVAIAAHVREASQRFGLPEHWILAVIRIESAGAVRAVSSAGAMGLMQLMPGTWARQRARYSLGGDPFDPRDNIIAGTAYLREMFDRYGADGFLAAYNAGPGRYEQWRDNGRPLPLETRRYVAAITAILQTGRATNAARSHPERDRDRDQSGPADAARRAQSHTDPAVPANPFARPAMPAHDLFAPVSMGRDR
jgi:soluble lytic murein transglycosylase-like protein